VTSIKRIALEKLLSSFKEQDYQEQYGYVMQLIEEGKIKPVKSSMTNGKKPALHKEYWLVEPERDYSFYEQELRYQLSAEIGIDYYLRHLETYVQERMSVLALNAFLVGKRHLLNTSISYNERSFQIWQQEKFLLQGNGRTILKHCGIAVDYLNCYSTVEPFAYYAVHRNTPQNILIVENKDTFFSLRKALMLGKESILGMELGTLIYGKGKDVISSFKAFSITAEPYMEHKDNRLLYFGDLDYEGILIYENLAAAFADYKEIEPFKAAYEAMLSKGNAYSCLPTTKEGQNRNLKNRFFAYFAAETIERMQEILQAEKYIPQEILTIDDY